MTVHKDNVQTKGNNLIGWINQKENNSQSRIMTNQNNTILQASSSVFKDSFAKSLRKFLNPNFEATFSNPSKLLRDHRFLCAPA